MGLKRKIKETAMLGDPMDKENVNVGPLATASLLENLRNQVKNTVQFGANISYGSMTVPKKLKHTNGNFFQPIILEDIKPDSRAFNEEFLGPVFNIFKVQTDKEAVELSNKTEHAISSAVFSENIDRANNMISKLVTKNLYINEYGQRFFEVPKKLIVQ
jgi:succinate-semialdehyde dehydrogenase/glutarate-semialdehyde dehydrogenase